MLKKNKKTPSFFKYIMVFLFAVILTLITLLSIAYFRKPAYFTFEGYSFSENEYNVLYVSCMNSLISANLNEMTSYGLDLNGDFAKQYIDENITWEDFFKQETNTEIKKYVRLIEDSKSKNVEYDVRDDVKNTIKMFKANAKYTGISYKKYIESIFGDKIKNKDIKTALTFQFKATKYSNALADSLNQIVTDEDLLNVYKQFPDMFDTVEYKIVYFITSDYGSKEEAYKNALSFKEKNSELEEVEISKISGINNQSDIIQNWLFAERKEKDSDILETDNGYAYIIFLNRSLLEEETVNFRIIAIQNNNTNAENNANEVYNLWLNSNLSEDNFKALATIYSEVKNPNDDNIISGITKNAIDKELENWLFDESRKSSDYTFIKNQNGYYILYFLNKGDVYWKYLARKNFIDSVLNEYLNDIFTGL